MAVPIVQIPSIILPANYIADIDEETVADLLEHTSLEFIDTGSLHALHEKIVFIRATEVIAAGMPGNLWCWIEISPYLTATAPLAYWAAIGGGGGALPPIAPFIEVATGVPGTVHTLLLPWAIHTPYARLVVQTPVAAAMATAWWTVQAMVSAQGP